MLGLSVALYTGATFVIRKRFSASNFFKDCNLYNCTVVQYIGELLRYLNASPVTEWDTNHKVRMAMGNGLRKNVWIEFQERFKVKHIAEFYGATEGNATLVNIAEKPGAVGYMPGLIRAVYPVKLIRIDPEDEETPLRNHKGRCIEAKSGEVGLAIGLIKTGDPTRAFDGYTNKQANDKKILHDVIKKGDKWFNSGDLLRREGPYVYFVDRVGDTFRWKGENCSTREVEEVIEQADENEQMAEVNVYGVQIENNDGRAGMALIRLNDTVPLEDVDLPKLYEATARALATYQLPLFLRFHVGTIELTSTFKHKKVDLRKDGFDPSKVQDAMFFRNPETNSYVPIDEDMYDAIQGGKFKM